MDNIGKSSLWCEKYRPNSVKDLILPAKYKNLLITMIKKGEIQNLLLSGSAGLGKSSSAIALCKDISADFILINASLENNIDTLRTKVVQFASTSSFSDGKKVIILDETDRLSSSAMDALKGVIEQTEANCRFILTTNNLSKIIDPIKSRTQLIDFSFVQTDQKEIILQYFKRCQFILENEKIEFNKKILAEFIQKLYPDFRKITNELQKASSMFGCIDERVSSISADSLVDNVISALKTRKFTDIQKAANNIDPTDFYKTFYDKLIDVLDSSCIPDIIFILGEGNRNITNCLDKEIQLISDLMQICKSAKWK